MTKPENNYTLYHQIQFLQNIIFSIDKKTLEKEDCDKIVSEITKNDLSYTNIGRLYPSTYNIIISDLSYMYNSHVYPIIELLFDHIHVYTEDDIHMYLCILKQACIYGRSLLMEKLLHDQRMLSDVRDDYIHTYIIYSFWNDFCKKLPPNHNIIDIQKARIDISNMLLNTYPNLLLYSAKYMKHTIDKYYEIACENGLYLVAKYIILFCNMYHITIKPDSFDKMFVWACEKGIIELIQIYFNMNPYKYGIIYHNDTLRYSGDCIIHINNHQNTYGIIRSIRNELWERKRLVLYKLHYENRGESINLPMDIIRNVFSYLK